MLSILEVHRKRGRTRCTPPGFKETKGCFPSNENNSSAINASTNYRRSTCTNRKVRVMPVPNSHCGVSKTTKSEDRCHMRSVIQVEKRRAKYRTKPPGFHNIQSSNINNNSKQKAGSKDETEMDKKQNKEHSKSTETTKLNWSKFVNITQSDWSTRNFAKIKAPIKMKVPNVPVKAFADLKEIIKTKVQTKPPEPTRPVIFTDTVAEETVSVNVTEEIGDDHMNWTYTIDDRLSPENYMETCRYYDDAINNRRDMLKALYVLGDMLVTNELEGDRDTWVQYTETWAKEEQEWKEKCKASHAYFEKTRRTLGHAPDSLLKRAARIVQTARQGAQLAIKEACPCFFRSKEIELIEFPRPEVS